VESKEKIVENSTVEKLQLPWASSGLFFLVLPALLFAALSVWSWSNYSDHNDYLELEKAKIPEARTKTAASILDSMIARIQLRTDTMAEEISAMNIQQLNNEQICTLNNMAQSLTRLRVSCAVNEALGRGENPTCKVGEDALAYSLDDEADSGENVQVSQSDCYTQSRESAKTVGLGSRGEGEYTTHVYGSAVAFASDVIIKDVTSLWSTYYYRDDGELQQSDLHADKEGKEKDYTLEKTADGKPNKGNEWYYRSVNTKQNYWVDPYPDDAGKTYMITYSALIRRGEGGEIIGVLTADISINHLERIIEELITGYDGFGALTYGNGLYVYHPERNYVKKHRDLAYVAKQKNDNDRYRVEELAKAGQGQTISHVSTTTGEQSWLVVEPVPSSGWSLQNTFFKDSFYSKSESDERRRNEIVLFSSLMLFVVFFVGVILNAIGWGVVSIWMLSLLISAMLIAGIGNTWDLALNATKPKNGGDEVIDSIQSVEKKSNSYLKQLNGGDIARQAVIEIPTGIFVQTIELKDANLVNVSGRVWQVHQRNCVLECGEFCEGEENTGCKQCGERCNGELDSIEKTGIQFGSAKNVKFTQLPRETNENGDTVLSWWFQADIVSEFDYSRYPLEVEYLDIYVSPASVKSNVLLVPDVASYKFGSNRKAGLSEDIFVPGWEVFRSYFTLKPAGNAKPTFGMAQSFDNEQFNELHFKVGLKRIFVDAFISNLTPLIVVAIILFSVALLPRSIDISRILGICVSVFFVVVFSHLAIRRNISTGEIFYLEYFFFAIYAALLLVPVDAFRDTLGIESKTFDYKNGLVYKVLYWPSLLGIFYLVTVFKFI